MGHTILQKLKNTMKYLTTNYKEFIRQKMNEGIRQNETTGTNESNNKPVKDNWWIEMRDEFEKIMKESDEIHNSNCG